MPFTTPALVILLPVGGQQQLEPAGSYGNGSNIESYTALLHNKVKNKHFIMTEVFINTFLTVFYTVEHDLILKTLICLNKCLTHKMPFLTCTTHFLLFHMFFPFLF